MASPRDRLRELTDRLLDVAPVEVDWKNAADLARLSSEAMAGQYSLGRQLISLGMIRLAGEGVQGSSAPLDAVGDVMRAFQRLVTTSGAAHESFKSARGPLPVWVVSRTVLRLVASPGSGSVVFEFTPNEEPASELAPGGVVPLFDEPTDQLADIAVMDALEVLEAIHTVGMDGDGSEFLANVSERGPRFASALKDFATSLAQAEFSTEFAWKKPGAPTARAAIASIDASRIASFIKSRELDAEIVTIDGVLRTISDLTNIVVEISGGEFVAVAANELPVLQIERATLHSRVRLLALMTTEVRPGGVEVAKYRATSMEILDE